ncbi:MAG TPA: aspartate aminotransferase family protein [Chloroflexi bacterium]|nr:aspartate aminotransferase family protein [Chloroflexota bacterium]HAF18944.1 aspartate aminotransferase family protein [Chloroflexota bacterium]
MPDPLSDQGHVVEALRLAAAEAESYLATIDTAPVRPGGDAELPDAPLPREGVGSLEALNELIAVSRDGATRSSGPRFFHFVMGGGTPAALAADWLSSALDQNAYNWVSSPLAARLEQISLNWLKELFGLPAAWSAVLTTGATMANFVGLAAARRWWGLEQGVDVESAGMSGLPPMTILSSGYVHVSALKAVAMLGLGRGRVRTLSRDAAGRVDLDAMAAALREHDSEPVVIIANAGEVNTGDFDPLADIVALARKHRAWVHVDGAFGLFAAVSPQTRHLVEGVQLADSVTVDGHKWLNVPYDTGFAFVREPEYQAGAFDASAAYLGSEAAARPVFGNLGPEMSRRARSLAVWATLRAYGSDGYRSMVERHLRLAQRVAAQVDDAPDLERLADVPLNVICFRYRPHGVPEDQLDDLNRRVGELVLEDGRVYFGTTVYRGNVCFRPAIVNWRTREQDVDLIVATVRELGVRAVAQAVRASARP